MASFTLFSTACIVIPLHCGRFNFHGTMHQVRHLHWRTYACIHIEICARAHVHACACMMCIPKAAKGKLQLQGNDNP